MAVDIVHAHDIYTNVFFVPWARALSRCRTIASRRWSREVPNRHLAVANRVAYRFAHRVLANSRALTPLLLREGVPKERIVHVRNFLDDSAFVDLSPASVSSWRATYGIPPGAFLIGIVARLVPVKNHLMLVRAVRALDENCWLAIVGEGPEKPALMEAVRAAGIESRVRFLGELRGAANLHAPFDVSVLCSKDEGFPNSLIEAFAAGRAVVATDVGGVKELVSDSENGLLVAPNDEVALSGALQSLRVSAELRARLGAKARADALAGYSSARAVDELLMLYSELATMSTSTRQCLS